MNRATASTLAIPTMWVLYINIKPRHTHMHSHSNDFLSLLHAQKQWKSTPRYTKQTLTCTNGLSGEASPLPRVPFHAVCLCERKSSVCMNVQLWASTCLCLLVVAENYILYLQTRARPCQHPPHVCLFKALVSEHTLTQIFVSAHFSEGGNNLIVWVNPKSAALQKQSFSEHLQEENLSDNREVL